MIFGLLYFCVVILFVNRSCSSFILYRIVKRHSRQSNVRRIWTCADIDWSSHPIPVYRDRYRLMKTVQIWTVRFHETSIKFAKFSKIV